MQNSRWWWFAPKYWISNTRKPLIIIDDVQYLFKYRELMFIQRNILTGILVPARDLDQASIMLISSDFSIANDITSLSGMSSRITIFPFPKIDQAQINEYFQKEIENFRKINKFITLECLKEFFSEFNTDLRSLNFFIKKYKGNYQGN